MSLPAYRITLGERILAYRRATAISQREFGRLLGVSAQAVSKWEQNLCCPDILVLPGLAQILACSIDDFFEVRDPDASR